MPSLDYIEKLTGIKEEWIQNFGNGISLGLAVQLPPQEHICTLIVKDALQDA